MGVRDKIKNIFDRIFNKNKVKALNEPIKERNFIDGPISVSTSDFGDNIAIEEIKFHNSVNYSDGKSTILMLAKINRKNDNKSEEFVAFEVKPGAILNNVLLSKIVGYYLHEKNFPENQSKNCYYIGELNNTPNDNKKVKNKKLQEYIDNEISSKLPTPQYQSYKILSKNFENTLKSSVYENETKNIEINNVFLKQRVLHDQNYEKKYHDYDGTKTDNGKILRIRKLTKVGKDKSGRYLYTAFLREAHSEDNLEKVYSQDEEPVGLPVCFTLDGRFEDIVENQNPIEMKKVLDMLSSRETFDRNWNKLNYIGHLDINTGKIDRDVYNNSSPIVNEIQKLQKEYEEKNKDLTNQKEIG